MTKKVELFSGKVLKVSPAQVSTNRYKWLKLSEAEPDLGVATIDGGLLYSDNIGTRTFSDILRTDVDGNLFTGQRIESSDPLVDLEIGTPDDANLNVRITSGMVVEGDLTVNGNFTVDVELTEITLADGSVITIGTDVVLSQTTLGPSVIESSLESVGTVTTGVWEATPIAPDFGGTGIGGDGNGVQLNAILAGNGTNPMNQVTGNAFEVLQLGADGAPVFGGLDAGGY